LCCRRKGSDGQNIKPVSEEGLVDITSELKSFYRMHQGPCHKLKKPALWLLAEMAGKSVRQQVEMHEHGNQTEQTVNLPESINIRLFCFVDVLPLNSAAATTRTVRAQHRRSILFG
jgi:hypothetical protein